MNKRIHRGRSIGEVLIVLLLVAAVVAIFLPSMLQSRERSRRVACQQNLQKLATALQTYHAAAMHYPAGSFDESGTACNLPTGFHHNWLTGLVERLGYDKIESEIDRTLSVYAPENLAAATATLPGLLCPSRPTSTATEITPQANMTSYAGNLGPGDAMITAGRRGVFVLNNFVAQPQITDGLEFTVFVGEKLTLPNDLGWISGTRSSLRNGRIMPTGQRFDDSAQCRVGGFRSGHNEGAYVLMGSGATRFLTALTDAEVLDQLTGIADQAD